MKKKSRRGPGQFPPGVSGNPNGRPRLPAEVTEFRKASKETVIKEFRDLWAMSAKEVDRIASDKEQPVLRKFIAQALSNAHGSGDFKYIDPILNRVHGPVIKEFKGELDHKMNIHSEIVNIINEIEGGPDGNEESSEEDEENIN